MRHECALSLLSVSGRLSFSVSKDLPSPTTIFPHRTPTNSSVCVCVCVVCASSARHQPAWHKHFLVLALARIPPSPQTQIPQSLSLYISYFLPLVHPTRSFLGLVRKGEISVACLGWVDLWGGSWGPGGEKELLASLPGWSERSTLLYFLSFTRRNNNALVDKRLGRA